MTKNEYQRSLRESALARSDFRRELYARFATIDYAPAPTVAARAVSADDRLSEIYSEGRIYKRGQFTSHEI